MLFCLYFIHCTWSTVDINIILNIVNLVSLSVFRTARQFLIIIILFIVCYSDKTALVDCGFIVSVKSIFFINEQHLYCTISTFKTSY